MLHYRVGIYSLFSRMKIGGNDGSDTVPLIGSLIRSDLVIS